jgi:hypothetical protein
MSQHIRRRPVATGPQPVYKKGEFQEYRSTNTFHVGQHENLQIYIDDIIEYDGYTLRIGYDEYPAHLRGAIRSGWLVPVADTESQYVPQAAGVVMAPADTTKSRESHVVGGASMSSDERIVGSREGVRQRAQGGGQTRQARQVTGTGVAMQGVVTVDAGIEVGRVNVPAEAPRKELTRSNAHLAGRAALNQAANPNTRAQIGINSEALREIAAADPATAGMSDEELAEWEATQERRRLATLQAEAEREARRAKFEAEGGLPMREHDRSSARAKQDALARKRATYAGAGAVPFDEANAEETSHALHAMEPEGTPVPQTAQVGTVSGGPSMPSRIKRTKVGVDWELGRPAHVRMKDAMERFGWSKDILRAIAEVEEDDVARFLYSQLGEEIPEAKPEPAQEKKPAPKPAAAPDPVEDDYEEDPELEDLDAELAGAGEEDLEPGAVITSSGIAWNPTDPPHWASRVKKAISEFGTNIEDLESIAEVEIPAVSKRLIEHADQLREMDDDE